MSVLYRAVLLGALALAFANGANDSSKSVATLVGSGHDARRSSLCANGAVFAGGLAALWFGAKMTALFGSGLLAATSSAPAA